MKICACVKQILSICFEIKHSSLQQVKLYVSVSCVKLECAEIETGLPEVMKRGSEMTVMANILLFCSMNVHINVVE